MTDFFTELIREYPVHFAAFCIITPAFVVSGSMVLVEVVRINRKRRKTKGDA